MDAKKRKKPSFYCGICSADLDSLLEKGIPVVKYPDPYNENISFSICQKCLPAISKKFYIEEKKTKIKNKSSKLDLLTPEDIYLELNNFVVGQDKAKKAMSIAVANHLQRIYNPSIQKSNLLIMGPTGSGKTELVRSISKIVSLPYVVVDATTFTAEGYVGEDVSSILVQLFEASEGKKNIAERGIVFIDEVDKLASSKRSSENIGTIAVQQALLKMMEGGMVKIYPSGSKKDNGTPILIDTSKILFICSGAFPGLDEEDAPVIGLDSLEKKKREILNTKKLQKYGLIPEFIGRIPVLTSTETLSKKDLINILTEPENSLTSQYKNLFHNYGVNIEFSKKFLNEIAEEALKLDTGARGLKTILEEKLEPLFFNIKNLSKKKLVKI